MHAILLGTLSIVLVVGGDVGTAGIHDVEYDILQERLQERLSVRLVVARSALKLCKLDTGLGIFLFQRILKPFSKAVPRFDVQVFHLCPPRRTARNYFLPGGAQ